MFIGPVLVMFKIKKVIFTVLVLFISKVWEFELALTALLVIRTLLDLKENKAKIIFLSFDKCCENVLD